MTGPRENTPKSLTTGGIDEAGDTGTLPFASMPRNPSCRAPTFIEGDRESWRKAIAAGVSGFKEEFPKMNEIILGSLKDIEGELATQSASAKGA